MEKHCTKCKGNNIEELVWVNQITGEISDREDQFYCCDCGAKVEIIIAAPLLSWIEDIDPLEEDDTTPPLATNETDPTHKSTD